MLTRRRFLASLGMATGAAVLLRPQQTAPDGRHLYRRQLSRPLEQLRTEYDVVIVGSGYGGGICAARLAGRGKSVCVLERGKEFRGGSKPLDFPFKNEFELTHELNGPLNPLGLYNVHHGTDLDVVHGFGLGGTSLINANVMYLPEPLLFENRRWPQQINLASLAKYYALAGKELRAEPYALPLPLKAQRFKQAAAEHGEWKLPPIAVTTRDYPEGAAVDMLRCVECGSCVTGCNFAAKNTVDMTYLPRAEAAGAEIFTRIRVRSIEKDRNADRYVLHYVAQTEKGEKKGTLAAKMVILAAGSLGSTELLLRSRAAHNLELPKALGTQFSGNADTLGFAYNTEVSAGIETGPTIVSSVEFWKSESLAEHVIVEEGAMPKGLLDASARAMATFEGLHPSTVPRTSKEKFEDWKRTLKDLVRFDKEGALSHTLLFLGMGHDSASGRMMLDKLRDTVSIEYPNYHKEPVFARVNDAMQKLTEALGGTFLKNPMRNDILWRKMTTVHPLGGCPMDGRDGEKVVNHVGQVRGHENLYVADGSILPTSMGVNPSFTISALAERIAENLQKKLGQL
jgi:cholesterol oxidase